MSLTYDLFAGRALRDAGIELVEENSGPVWIAMFDSIVSGLPSGWEGTGEDMRKLAADSGLPDAHHPNAYGARISALLRRGVIGRTGEWRQMKAPKSHARLTPVYRR